MKTINIDMKSVVAAVESLETLSRGFAEAASAFKELVRPFEQAKEQAEKPESLVDKFKAEFEASRPQARPQARPVQAELPLPAAAACLPITASRARLGDVGYENEPNPNRQACGQIGGLATAGVKRAPSPDRRRPGTVMVKDMSVNEKRRYWRWTKFRAAQRAAGAKPVSWAAWVGAVRADA